MVEVVPAQVRVLLYGRGSTRRRYEFCCMVEVVPAHGTSSDVW